MKIVFLVSGEGGTLKFIHEFLSKEEPELLISYVIADRECGAIKYAESRNIPYQKIEYNNNNRRDLLKLLLEVNPDIIVTNIHKIIDADTLSCFKDRFINLHYSILPSFGGMIGMRTVSEAHKCNSKFIGATCHYVNEQLDGGLIISQSSFAVNWVQPIGLIQDTVFQSGCLILLNSILIQLNKKADCVIKNMEINSNLVTFNSPLIFRYNPNISVNKFKNQAENN